MPADYEVRLLRIAEEDFVEIISFISQDSPSGAEKIATIIEASLKRLSNHPHLGRVPNEHELAGAGFRYLIVENYLIFYTIEETTIYIHRILHGARDYKKNL